MKHHESAPRNLNDRDRRSHKRQSYDYSVCFALTFFVLLSFPLSSVQAKVFRNAYVSFEVPDRWDCSLEQTEWICRVNSAGPENREAIIILTAKEVGPSDSIPAFEEHLKRPRTIANRMGQPLQSNVLKVEQRRIGNHPWIDGMHMSSEVPNYYTRYLATTKDKIAILVTFSAHKLHYTKYSADFFRSIESMRVIATRNLMGSRGDQGAVIPGADTFGAPTANSFASEGMGQLPDELEGQDGGGSSAKSILGFAFLLAAVGIYLFMKNKQKKR